MRHGARQSLTKSRGIGKKSTTTTGSILQGHEGKSYQCSQSSMQATNSESFTEFITQRPNTNYPNQMWVDHYCICLAFPQQWGYVWV